LISLLELPTIFCPAPLAQSIERYDRLSRNNSARASAALDASPSTMAAFQHCSPISTGLFLVRGGRGI